MLLSVIKNVVGKLDWLLLIAAVCLFASFDYSNLTTVNIIYIVTFVLWFVMLCARVIIVYKGGKKK